MDQNSILGKSVERVDAREKVNGQALYVSDIQMENLRYAVVLRSCQHHARILSIDTTAAQRLPGVLAIIGANDVPADLIYGALIQDRPILAKDVVRFYGEPIAIIVAKTRPAAEAAREAILVIYDPLPAIHDPVSALDPTAQPIHPNGNQIAHFEVEQGDPAAGFVAADVILEETFRVPAVYPGYLETETSLAVWKDDILSVWVSSQKPFVDRHAISGVLGLPEERIHVKSGPIGGAFGGKEDSNIAILAALAAFQIQGAVRLVNTRTESILGHPKRHACHMQYRIGAQRDGTIIALTATVHIDTGAYASYGPAVAQLLTETIPGPYHIPNSRADTYLVYTNNLIAGAMRGFGSPQTNFAYESLMDMLAEKLAMDPGELRRRNVWRGGDHNFTGARVNQAEMAAHMLELAIQESERLQTIPASPGKAAGVGLGLALQTMGLGAGVPDDSSNRMEWLSDGRVRLVLGAPDLGQGLMTVAAQMTAESLGLPLDHIEVAYIDTSTTPNGGVTCASRMTYLVGNSIAVTSRGLVQNLIEKASQLLNVPPGQILYNQGTLTLNGKDNEPIPVEEITSRLAEIDQVLQYTGTASFEYGPETPDHLPIGMPHVLFCLGAQVARVEVDPLTGLVDITDFVAIHDLGKIIHRQGVEGQIEGGVAMGIGYALTENLSIKANGQWNHNLSEYLMPTSLDMPARFKSILLEAPEDSSEFGVKGIGEVTLVSTASAISNAIFQATGVRARSLPITPETLVCLG